MRTLALLAALAGLIACSAGGSPPAAAPTAASQLPPAAGAAAAQPAPTTLPTPVHMVVNWSAVSGSQTGLWMSYEGGYFQQEGLDVELTNIQATSKAIQAMVAGEVQMGSVDPAAAIQSSLSGADIVMLFASVNRLVFSIMAQPTIHQPAELRGKSLGITRYGSSTNTAALVALDLWGLVPDRDVSLLQLQEVPAILAGMQAGQVDAGVVSPPTNSRARQAGFNELINLATDGPEYPSVAVGGPRAWVSANDEAVRRFARAYVQGIHRFKTDKPWAIEVYRKYLRVDDPQVLDDTYVQFSAYFPSVPYVSEAGAERLLADLASDDPRLAGRPVSDWIDSHYVRDLETSGYLRQLLGDSQ